MPQELNEAGRDGSGLCGAWLELADGGRLELIRPYGVPPFVRAYGPQGRHEWDAFAPDGLALQAFCADRAPGAHVAMIACDESTSSHCHVTLDLDLREFLVPS